MSYLPNAYVTASITPTLDTSAYTAADVLFDTTEIVNASPYSGGTVLLDSLTVLDKDDQTAAAMTLFILDRNVSLGTINSAISITDTNAEAILGVVSVADTLFTDLINSKLASVKNIGLLCRPNGSSRSLWVAASTAGTPTQTASGIVLRFGFRWLS